MARSQYKLCFSIAFPSQPIPKFPPPSLENAKKSARETLQILGVTGNTFDFTDTPGTITQRLYHRVRYLISLESSLGVSFTEEDAPSDVKPFITHPLPTLGSTEHIQASFHITYRTLHQKTWLSCVDQSSNPPALSSCQPCMLLCISWTLPLRPPLTKLGFPLRTSTSLASTPSFTPLEHVCKLRTITLSLLVLCQGSSDNSLPTWPTIQMTKPNLTCRGLMILVTRVVGRSGKEGSRQHKNFANEDWTRGCALGIAQKAMEWLIRIDGEVARFGTGAVVSHYSTSDKMRKVVDNPSEEGTKKKARFKIYFDLFYRGGPNDIGRMLVAKLLRAHFATVPKAFQKYLPWPYSRA
ncbi:hypothetical protein LTS10_012559 [Elasticomyces elasticus]|nr:hypothetical protein LTS10_012559 [Elasticomyces elasticus]